jgi:hypothetical protein
MEGKEMKTKVKKISVLVIVAAVLVLTTGCFSTPPLRTGVGLYPNQPTPVKIKGSSKQFSSSRNFPFTFDDVFQAANDNAFRKGLIIEEKNEEAGTIVGNGYWQMICGAGPCGMNITYIIYVDEVDDNPTTRLTFLFDRYTITGWGGEAGVANDFLVEVQKILATY